jgi:hypothetical protein
MSISFFAFALLKPALALAKGDSPSWSKYFKHNAAFSVRFL